MSDIATVLGLSNGSEKDGGKDGKNQKKDTLFGPSIGVSGGGPDWCSPKDKLGKEDDELTSEIVKEWIAKSKEVSKFARGQIHLCLAIPQRLSALPSSSLRTGHAGCVP